TAAETGAHRDAQRGLSLVADVAIDEVTAPDVLVVPGGPGEVQVRHDLRVLDWLREMHETTTWTTSVCTGSLVLAEAGLLDGVAATSHWLALDELSRLGAAALAQRIVVDGKIITAAGASAGIDMALLVASLVEGDLVAQQIQLSIEYEPEPPFDAGSPSHAPAVVVELARATSRFARTV
ncbi:MAG: DJ-1/PfpI family protein, partial [Actinobacteria bacterium]|nr:DJ-1/PfpI family protein [Actinomycetota bacterium]